MKDLKVGDTIFVLGSSVDMDSGLTTRGIIFYEIHSRCFYDVNEINQDDDSIRLVFEDANIKSFSTVSLSQLYELIYMEHVKII